MLDTRNVADEFKNMPHDDIVMQLDERGVELEVAIENLERDFNMGTIVRSANAFGVRHIHVVGRKQWNRRGAMMTDKYLQIHYYASIDEFMSYISQHKKVLVALENNRPDTQALGEFVFPNNTVLLFGSESSGITDELLKEADKVVSIEQLGSTRSLNIGVAAGVAMYTWLQQHKLTKSKRQRS